MTISLCMIVKNEEDVLARCLESASGIYDELIIADTGSTDKTKEIAASFGAKIFDFPWIDDFSAARNFAFSQATQEFLLWLDADDILEPAQKEAFLALKAKGTSADILYLQYKSGSLLYYRERLVRRSENFVWQEPVHEVIAPKGKIERHEIFITHQKIHFSDPSRNLRIYENLLAQGKPLSPRGQYYMARELCDHKRFSEALPLLQKFLDGKQGFREDNIGACLLLSACFKAENNPFAQEKALYESFVFDLPRPETCCRLGMLFSEQSQWEKAVFWYRQAMEVPKSAEGFVNANYSGILPALGLCFCFYRLGDAALSRHYNELAASFQPDNPSVLHNRAYFEKNPPPS